MARSKPLHQSIFESLHLDLAEGRYRAGQKFPSEAALVKRFGVSRITVGHALRELERRGMVDRVAGSGTYVTGVEQRPREGMLFGLVIPNLGETEIFEPICKGIQAPLLWPHADTSAAGREEQTLKLCRQSIAGKVSGVFFAPLELHEDGAKIDRAVMRMLREANIPVVLLDRRPDDSPSIERCDLVGIDNHRAGYLAARHLADLGARRIGFLAYRNQASTVKTRIQGFREALGVEAAYARVFHVPAESPLELPAGALDCDAFVCANDRIAGLLMHALLARGVRIPQDVRIVGIDDVTYAPLLPVPLTSVHQPCREIGEAALGVMLDRLSHPRMPARDVLLDCRLVIRRSCGAPG